MNCPKCNGDTRVIDCVFNKDENKYYRTRICKECKKRFRTTEEIVEETVEFLDTFYHYRRRQQKPKTK